MTKEKERAVVLTLEGSAADMEHTQDCLTKANAVLQRPALLSDWLAPRRRSEEGVG